MEIEPAQSLRNTLVDTLRRGQPHLGGCSRADDATAVAQKAQNLRAHFAPVILDDAVDYIAQKAVAVRKEAVGGRRARGATCSRDRRREMLRGAVEHEACNEAIISPSHTFRNVMPSLTRVASGPGLNGDKRFHYWALACILLYFTAACSAVAGAAGR